MKIQTILVIIFFIIILFSTESLGKYFSKTNVEVTTGIAKPILKIEGDSELKINKIGEKEIYKFKVKNYDESNKITEINLEYYIEIISKINENIDMKIYKEDKELKLSESRTEKFLLTKDNQKEDNYKIEILFKNNSVQEIKQNIEIKVYAEQKE